MLSEKQKQSFVDSDARFNIWVGSVRSGKTFISLRRFIDFLQNGPEGDAMIVGVSRETIQRNVISQMFQILHAREPGPKTMTIHIFGRRVFLVGANDLGSVRKIKGSTLVSCLVDEVTEVPEEFFKMLQSRLSKPGATLFGTTNPSGPSHWFKKNYIDRRNELDLKWWTFTLEDNPSLDEAYKRAIRNEYTGVWYDRYIEGRWAVATGVVFESFDEMNIYTDRKVNPHRYVAGIDYGIVNPAACLVGGINEYEMPQIQIEREYFYDSMKAGRAKTDAELADDIQEFLAPFNVESIFIDPSAASFKVELRNRNLPVVDAPNDVLPGIQIMSKFIEGKNLQIHESCVNLQEELQTYAWDPSAADRGIDKPLKKFDHAIDSCRYLCNGTFPTGEFVPQQRFSSHEERLRYVFSDDDSPLDSAGILI